MMTARYLLAVGLACVARMAAGQDNESVLAVAHAYPDGGGYNRTWAGSGSPEEIVHDGRQVLAESEGGTYCCGFTFAVAMRVANERGLLDEMPFARVKRFQKLWYGATELEDETLVVLAAEALGVGKGVPIEEARPGDFVQLWRVNKEGKRGSGHSVVLLGWVEEACRKVGFRYRSSQGSTDGIGEATEYFTDAPGHQGRVMRERTYACRLFANATEASKASTTRPVGSGTAVDDDGLNEAP